MTNNIKSISKEEGPKKKTIAIERNKVEHIAPVTNKYEVIIRIPGLSHYIELLEIPTHKISNHLLTILQFEGALHIKDAAKRITDFLGIGRIGNRIMEHILQGAKYGHKNKLFFYHKQFLYLDASKNVVVRDRSLIPPNLKKIENVPPQEIQLALIETISMAFSLPESEAISEALSLMGFTRSTEKARTILKLEISKLLKQKKIRIEEEKLMI